MFVFQRVLVVLDYHEEALLVAERGRTRAFVDLLLERQDSGSDTWHNKMDSSPVMLDAILATVDQQKCAVIYYFDRGWISLHLAVAPKQRLVVPSVYFLMNKNICCRIYLFR